MDPRPRPELIDFHGVSMTRNFTQNWEDIQNFQARPDDVLIASYPKAGNTWLCYITDLLYFSQTAPEREQTLQIYQRIPHLEASFEFVMPDMINNLPSSPRLIKTHLPVQFLPKTFFEQNCKIIYISRNAKDSVVSYFHMERMTVLLPEPGDWRSYVQRFMEGKMVFGSWYDHVSGWWKKKQTYPQLHYMFYEDLVQDTGREIDKLCFFLGLSPSAEEKERIISKVQFDEMKTNNMVNMSSLRTMDFTVSSFIRKGKVGDWKNHFTVAQNKEFDEDYKKKMKDPTLVFHTEI
ncbi:cytosolic sulfotransferase 3-like isoform X2 [Cheilinus undulatus]|uniref:cytosolic sulfotransferase 3-like isoform X2 n=1 Tax=Cheilinus undulatus TaxID=241271 RepID=UPI001BD1CE50|nr:cytosolic sulfotransferase 3-like isoform X2 [Cheilinus undulatus]